MGNTNALAHDLAATSEQFVTLQRMLKAEQDSIFRRALFASVDVAETRYEEAKAKWAMRT
ncbi:MAG TPA: hypothetical protein VGG45_16400 [Terracidiphilus sp.]|jgi:hypothetical protein